MSATGLSREGADIIHPQNIHGAVKLVAGNARSLAVVLDSPAVAVKLSAYMADCVILVINRFVEASQIASASHAHSQKHQVLPQGGLNPDAERDWDQEDLRCGLFEKTQVAASRPGPLSFFLCPRMSSVMRDSRE